MKTTLIILLPIALMLVFLLFSVFVFLSAIYVVVKVIRLLCSSEKPITFDSYFRAVLTAYREFWYTLFRKKNHENKK